MAWGWRKKQWLAFTLAVGFLAGCAQAVSTTEATHPPASLPTRTQIPAAASETAVPAQVENFATVTPIAGQFQEEPMLTAFPTSSAPCSPAPVVRPTLPATIPGYTQLDPTTNLHVTGQYQLIDAETYRLKVSGKVDHPLNLGYDDLRCLPKVQARPTLICFGVFTDRATWAGAPLATVLDLAGVQPDAKQVRLTSADGYVNDVSIEDALNGEAFLAYEWEGQPLPVLHGFPVRAVFPHLYGNNWVKWLVEIEVR